jgi:hypothetical protein
MLLYFPLLAAAGVLFYINFILNFARRRCGQRERAAESESEPRPKSK